MKKLLVAILLLAGASDASGLADMLRGASETTTTITVSATTGATLTIPSGVCAYEIKVDAKETSTEFVYYSDSTIGEANGGNGFQIDRAGKQVSDVILPAKTHYFVVQGAYAVKIFARWVKAL